MIYPKVSIITPSYNQAQFLEQCIQSVLSQDYNNIEFIVIDGGSTDNSVDIIKKYTDKITYWVSESDDGQSHAINKGFKRATGDIVAWLNSDDLYFPDAVSTAVKRFEEQPGLTLFYGNAVWIGKNGEFIRYFTEIEPYNQKRLLNYSDFIMQPTTFFSRQKLIEVGYLDESLYYAMDWDLWCKLSKTGTFLYEEKLIAAHRDYEATKTNSGGYKRLKELLKIQCRHITGFWPHAFWGFLSYEIYKRNSNRNLLIRFVSCRLAKAISHMSPTAIKFHNTNIKNKNLYGFKPYSHEIPEGYAEIHLPYIDDDYKFSIELMENVDKELYINRTAPSIHPFSLNNSMSIELEIKDENNNRCGGTVKIVRT